MDKTENIEKKKDDLLAKMESYKNKRDRLNDKAGRWADKRDELNSKVKELIATAGEHRKKRGLLNEQVKNAKEKKKKLMAEEEQLSDTLGVLIKECLPEKGPYLSKLKNDLRALEFRQQTAVLTPKKEKALVGELSKIQKQIKEKEKMLEENKEVKEILTKLKQVRNELHIEKKKIAAFAHNAQKEHNEMNLLYSEADKLRKEADNAQKKFVENKILADKEHKEYVSSLEELKKIDKGFSGLKPGRVKFRVDSGLKQQAEEIYKKFKDGEKLSTEDLMILQKAGLL